MPHTGKARRKAWTRKTGLNYVDDGSPDIKSGWVCLHHVLSGTRYWRHSSCPRALVTELRMIEKSLELYGVPDQEGSECSIAECGWQKQRWLCAVCTRHNGRYCLYSSVRKHCASPSATEECRLEHKNITEANVPRGMCS